MLSSKLFYPRIITVMSFFITRDHEDAVMLGSRVFAVEASFVGLIEDSAYHGMTFKVMQALAKITHLTDTILNNQNNTINVW